MSKKEIIDLTLELYNVIQSWYIHPKLSLEDYHTIGVNRCHTKLMTLTDHTGTHVDSQTHFFDNGMSIAEYEPDKFMGEALFLDVSFRDIDNAITVQDLEKALEDSQEEIFENDILVMKAWPLDRDHEKFDKSPGLSPEAAKWILKTKIKLIATDLATVDHQDNQLTTHNIFLKNNLLIIENLVNLDKINKRRFDFVGLPLKINGATGSPVRAVAIIN